MILTSTESGARCATKRFEWPRVKRINPQIERMLWVAVALVCCQLFATATAEEGSPNFIYEFHEAEGNNATGSAAINGETLSVTVSVAYDPNHAAADGPSSYTVYIDASPAGKLLPTQWEDGAQRPSCLRALYRAKGISVLEMCPNRGNGSGSIKDYRNRLYLLPANTAPYIHYCPCSISAHCPCSTP